MCKVSMNSDLLLIRLGIELGKKKNYFSVRISEE